MLAWIIITFNHVLDENGALGNLLIDGELDIVKGSKGNWHDGLCVERWVVWKETNLKMQSKWTYNYMVAPAGVKVAKPP